MGEDNPTNENQLRIKREGTSRHWEPMREKEERVSGPSGPWRVKISFFYVWRSELLQGIPIFLLVLPSEKHCKTRYTPTYHPCLACSVHLHIEKRVE